MADLKQVYKFALKWLNKFKDKKTNYKELTDDYMGEECSALGFQIYCGYTFFEKYGKINNLESFKKILEEVTDINLLGSAIYSKWSYFNHWAYEGAEILEEKNRMWFILALSRLVKISEEKPFGEIKKIKIISNTMSYEYCLEPDDEIEQHITIESDGHIWFSAYIFEKRKDSRYKKSRMNNFKIKPFIAEEIISAVSSYFTNDSIQVFRKNTAVWSMEIINKEGKIYKLKGSICPDFENYGVEISNLIRSSLKMPDLYLFDGNFETDTVERIVIDYHRTTKVKTKQLFNNFKGYLDWDYTEKIIIDRETKSMEHMQNIGTGCTVSKKYTSESWIEDLLDDVDTDCLLEEINKEAYDIIATPLEKRNYTLTVTLRKGGEKKISGNYNKKGLPGNWEDFMEEIFDFISFYGCGEILNPAVYGKDYNDIILCSVKFKSGNKSYYYISENDDIEVGDFVIVPVGIDNYETTAEVVKIDYFSEGEVPFSLEKIKHIIRKCEKYEI